MHETRAGSNHTAKLNRVAFAAGAAAVLVYFVSFAGGGVRVGFSYDDLMNMHGALVDGTLARHLAHSLLFFLPAVRPLGAALYRLTYDLAGMNPFPLRAVCFALALLNVGLLFLVTRKASGSFETGLLAALIGAFHCNLLPLYYNSGMCYDLLCFPLYYSALLLYVSIRRQGRTPDIRETALVFLCFVLALGAKEIALSFPLILIAYELIWDPPRSVRACGGWILRQGRMALLCGAAAAGFVAVRVYGAQGLANMPAYRPTYSSGAYLNVLSYCLNDLIYRVDAVTPLSAAVFCAALIAIAALLRSRFLIFCASLTLIGMLPIGFISPRGLGSAYVPLVGLWAYAAGLLVHARRHFMKRFVLVSQIALFATVLILLVRVDIRNFNPAWQTDEAAHIRNVINSLNGLHLELPRGARVLMVNDPFESRFEYDSFFLLRLNYHDPDLELEQCVKPAPEAPGGYAAVLTYEGGKIQRVQGCAGRACCSR